VQAVVGGHEEHAVDVDAAAVSGVHMMGMPAVYSDDWRTGDSLATATPQGAIASMIPA